jgi:dTDP-4-dehydrorhamnose reductase
VRKKRLVLVGAGGMLGSMVARCLPLDYELILCTRSDFDLGDPARVEEALDRLAPEVIVNCAAFTQVDACETQEEQAARINGDGPGYLAGAAVRLGAVLVHISTDYVFDGSKRSPYTEEDWPNPRSAYGRSKLLGEEKIVASGLASWFILRTSWLYGPGGKNFVETILRLAQEREELRVVADQIGTPTYTGDLAAAIFRLLPTGAFGLYHVSNQGECSWYEFACEIVNQFVRHGGRVKVKKIVPITTTEYPLPAARPAYSVFSKAKYESAVGVTLPPWQESLARYVACRSA